MCVCVDKATGQNIEKVVRLEFSATNNNAKYEPAIFALKIISKMEEKRYSYLLLQNTLDYPLVEGNIIPLDNKALDPEDDGLPKLPKIYLYLINKGKA